MAELTDLRTKLVKGAFKVMQSPRFVRLLQDKRVLNVIVDGMSLRARGRVMLRDLGTKVARAFGLVTLEDLRDLERDLERRTAAHVARAERPHAPNPSSYGARPTHEDSRFRPERVPPER